MLGKQLSAKETSHKVKILFVAAGFVIFLSILFCLISMITGTGVQKKAETTKATEDAHIVLWSEASENEKGETFPTAG